MTSREEVDTRLVVPVQATRRALDTLREQLAPEANDDELQWLAAVGQRLGLDPIAGHVVLIGRWDKRAQRKVHRPQITADGRLVLAERTGALDGFVGPEWTGPRNPDGGHTWVDVWDADEPPHAARVLVYRKGRAHPANGTVRWAEFAQRDGEGNLLATWRQMPSHMLGKVALSLGLRRGFGDVIPSDVIDDDFADYERAERVDASTGEITSSAAVPPAAEAGQPPAPAAEDGFAPAPAEVAEAIEGTGPLEDRLNALSGPDRAGFRAWLASKSLPWPPTEPDDLAAMVAEVDKIEARAAEDAEAYES